MSEASTPSRRAIRKAESTGLQFKSICNCNFQFTHPNAFRQANSVSFSSPRYNELRFGIVMLPWLKRAAAWLLIAALNISLEAMAQAQEAKPLSVPAARTDAKRARTTMSRCG